MHWHNVGPMLEQCHKWWHNIHPTLDHADCLEPAWHRTLLLKAKPSICLFHKCADTVLLQTRGRQWHQRKGSIFLLYKWANTAFWQRYGKKSQLKSSKCLVYQGAANAFLLCTGRTDVKRKLTTDVCSECQTKNLETLSPSWTYIIFSSRRHRRWAKGAMDSTSVFFWPLLLPITLWENKLG